MYNSIEFLNDILTVDEVSAILRTTKQQVRKMLRGRTIKSLKVCREYRIPKAYLIEFLNTAA